MYLIGSRSEIVASTIHVDGGRVAPLLSHTLLAVRGWCLTESYWGPAPQPLVQSQTLHQLSFGLSGES